ncbi:MULTISPECIES: MFS transporter [Methylosinus]|uniref:MFS transporter n=1 Tax=Methylosinus trichosporium (strain ATCC 35070 / NCIMB 11131 / UNIQEM 75 / OB3b) TaxID=595536 RepID=A0A2D2D2W2_METT3|nr:MULTISPECIES: MFS transporter [Methylosinus]ATQ69338.1 MFS transporter [Methylosinus trichosporium OB3b]OBS52521.1 Fosmidomycin resistance protein [Methylosinus sp. 3S-1]
MSSSRSIADRTRIGATVFPVLGAISFCHFLNDLMQSLLPAVYPLLKGGFDLDFGQIGLITFTYQITASLLQPLVGLYTDRRPQPYSLVIGMGATFCGLLALAFAPSFAALLAAAALMGIGSSIFHPESARIARLASGGAHGLAQSLFQVGGNFGASLGPLLAAFFILPRGQSSLAWFALAALGAMAVSAPLGAWLRGNGHGAAPRHIAARADAGLPADQRRWALAVLVALMFSKFVYLAALGNYYVFYLMSRFDLAPRDAQIYLFVFLATSAGGTVLGGALGDRFGRRRVIWGSILGVLPFTLALPYVDLPATVALSAIIGFMLASAFPAILVFAQELTPNRIGAVSGLFFGFAFGISGLAAAALGALADRTSIEFMFQLCAFLPLIGLLAVFLPREDAR